MYVMFEIPIPSYPLPTKARSALIHLDYNAEDLQSTLGSLAQFTTFTLESKRICKLPFGKAIKL